MLAFLALTVLVLCSETRRLSAEQGEVFPDIQAVVESGELRIATLGRAFPPMIEDSREDGVAGFDAELAKALAALLRVEPVFDRSADTFDGVVDLVAAREVDVGIAFLSRTVERAYRVLFSRPYAVQDLVLIVNRRRGVRFSNGCPTKADVLRVAGLPNGVGVVRDTAYEADALRVVEDESLQRFDDFDAMKSALLMGDIAMGYQGELVVLQSLKTNPSSRINLRLCPGKTRRDQISIAVRPDAPNLTRLIDIWLENRAVMYDVEEIVERDGKGMMRR